MEVEMPPRLQNNLTRSRPRINRADAEHHDVVGVGVVDDESLDGGEGVPHCEEDEESAEEWVPKHKEMYEAAGHTWTMPVDQPGFARYINNPWWASLSPRMQCSILYRDLIEPLDDIDPPEKTEEWYAIPEVFMDVYRFFMLIPINCY